MQYVTKSLIWSPNERHRWYFSGHVFADTPAELRDFAWKLHLQPDWIRRSPAGVPYLDVTGPKQKLAITKGAAAVSAEEALAIIARIAAGPGPAISA